MQYSYSEYLRNLLVTAIEVEEYSRTKQRYTDYKESLDLDARLNYYLSMLLDVNSHLSRNISEQDREYYLYLFSSMQETIQTHTQDLVASNYLSIPKKSYLTSKAIVKALQKIPRHVLVPLAHYKLCYHENLLEYISPIYEYSLLIPPTFDLVD